MTLEQWVESEMQKDPTKNREELATTYRILWPNGQPVAPTSTVPSITGSAVTPSAEPGIYDGLFDDSTTPVFGKTAIGLSGRAFFDKKTGRLVGWEPPIGGAATPTIGQPEPNKPKYFSGNEDIVAQWDPVKIGAFQQKLFDGGYFEGKKFTLNKADPATLGAMKNLMEDANLSDGITIAQALENSKTNPWKGKTGAQTGLGRAPAITPRQDVVASIDSASAQALGRKFTDQVTSGLVKQIQGREAGGDKTSLGQMSVAAAGKVAPDEAEAFKFAQYAQVFERLLGK